MRMTRISSALFILAMALVAACGTQSTGGAEPPAPAAGDPMGNDTAADTLNLK